MFPCLYSSLFDIPFYVILDNPVKITELRFSKSLIIKVYLLVRKIYYQTFKSYKVYYGKMNKVLFKKSRSN